VTKHGTHACLVFGNFKVIMNAHIKSYVVCAASLTFKNLAYIGRAYRYPENVAFYIFFFNSCKY
jgi:hypothetical protein